MPCKHAALAALAAIYAKQMAEMDEPWKLWERQWGAEWEKLETHPCWEDGYEYRQIPKTILINGIEVPEPMREKPEIGTEYWIVFSTFIDGVDCAIWGNSSSDNFLLKRGLCHLSRENCIIHAKALFSFSEVK